MLIHRKYTGKINAQGSFLNRPIILNDANKLHMYKRNNWVTKPFHLIKNFMMYDTGRNQTKIIQI